MPAMSANQPLNFFGRFLKGAGAAMHSAADWEYIAANADKMADTFTNSGPRGAKWGGWGMAIAQDVSQRQFIKGSSVSDMYKNPRLFKFSDLDIAGAAKFIGGGGAAGVGADYAYHKARGREFTTKDAIKGFALGAKAASSFGMVKYGLGGRLTGFDGNGMGALRSGWKYARQAV
jgi:hypothetical protein